MSRPVTGKAAAKQRRKKGGMMVNDEPSFFDEIDASIDFCSEVDKHLVGVDLAQQKVIIATDAALSIELNRPLMTLLRQFNSIEMMSWDEW